MFKKLKKIWESSILCIRFPFLYPRNVYTDKHHTSFVWLDRWYNKFYNKSHSKISLGYKFYNNPEDCKEITTVIEEGKFRIELIKGLLYIAYNHLDFQVFDLQKFIGNKFIITGITPSRTFAGNLYITFHCHLGEISKTNYGFCHKEFVFITNKFYDYCAKSIDWIYKYIIDNIFILPSYTKLDDMPKGWRKAFGIQMCKDIKSQLIKENYLYKYRILQIKEKFGTLRWYDARCSKDIFNIINKYEDLSYNTCICCGKPAKYISKGWISPYCADCIGNKSYTLINNDESDNS